VSSEPDEIERPALAYARQIGEDIEDLVLDAVDELRAVDEPNAHHDAEAVALLAPREVPDATLRLGSIPVVESDTHVEIKAALRRTDSAGCPRGRWFFKGREDGQHAALLDAHGVYLLAVYDEHDDGERVLLGMLVVPATIVDELLSGRWYDSGRVEGAVAKVTWSTLLDPDDLDDLDGGEVA
jgi:hypothetical protein